MIVSKQQQAHHRKNKSPEIDVAMNSKRAARETSECAPDQIFVCARETENEVKRAGMRTDE
jgi:hypothetical protein